MPVATFPLLYSVTSMNVRPFARNFNNRGKPNYRPLNKRKAANIDENDSDQMQQIRKMMGFTAANEHLLPPIKTKNDVGRIFSSLDPLALTNQDIKA